MTRSEVVSRLNAAGVSPAAADLILQRAYYGQAYHGEDAEDFLQEAIVVALSGGDIKKALDRLKNSMRRTSSLDAMLSDQLDDGGAGDVREKTSTDSERPDWIPDAPDERRALYWACKERIERTYSLRPKRPSGYVARVVVLGHEQHVGIFKNNQLRAAAERKTLRKIMAWVAIADERHFTTVCVRCGGPKSKYGVRWCRACVRAGAQREATAARRGV